VAEAEGLDPERVFAAFADYWRAKPGAGGTKLDWDATWRNWCRKEADTHTPRRSAFAPPRIRTATEIAEEYEARERASANA
jgi:hypothetical protein